MSEQRDLQSDLEEVIYWRGESGKIAMHAIDRAIAAEKERDELQKRVELLEGYLNELRELTPYGMYQEQITNVLAESHAIGAHP